MATDMDRAYCEWSHDEISNGMDSRAVSVTQILDHGSISFGRFSVETLSWEKWSVFTHNRCQEELEKFKTPGLVAQKKAYFEAYYKRIRALKALQDQQAETALDSGVNSSVYGQTSEEEHNILQDGNDISEAVTNQTNLPEENVIEVSIEQETQCDNPLNQNMEIESVVSFPDSSIRSIIDIGIEDVGEPKNDWKNLNIEVFPVKDECSIATVEVDTAAQGTLPVQMASTGKRDLNDAHTGSLVPKIVEQNIKRRKDFTSIQKAKGAASLRKPQVPKSNSTSKEAVATSSKDNRADVVKSSQGLRYPQTHKTISKAETGIGSKKTSNLISSNNKPISSSSSKGFTNMVSSISKSTNDSIPRKATCSKVPGGNRCTSVSSDRPLTEVRSNITIPRPFSLSTERRSTAAARDFTRSKEASNRLSGLSVHTKSMSVKQNSLIDMAIAGGVKDTGLAKRRSIEAVRKSAIDGQSTMPRGKDMENQRLKAMSINLPARSKSNYNNGNESSLRSNKRSEVKAETSHKQLQQNTKFPASPLPTFSRTGIPKPDCKKIVPSRSAELKQDIPKSRRGNPSWR